jgi:tetratricopeptide (TPR) repeat protein
MNINRLNQLLEMYDEQNHDSFILFAIAKEYEYGKEEQKAIDTFNALIQKDPQYVGTYYHLAQLYQVGGNIEDAMKIYEDGISVAKKLADFHALSELMNAKTNLEME